MLYKNIHLKTKWNLPKYVIIFSTVDKDANESIKV